jgi:hypothetical protein
MGVDGGLRRVERRDHIDTPWPPPYGLPAFAHDSGELAVVQFN